MNARDPHLPVQPDEADGTAALPTTTDPTQALLNRTCR